MKMSSYRKSRTEDLKGEDDNSPNRLIPRDFFWDNVVLLVVWSILALAAVDIIIEFVRGGKVACFPPNTNYSDAEERFINTFCASNVPFGAYISIFMVVHGLLIAVPHYLWMNHFSVSIHFFFVLATMLKKTKEDTGQYSPANILIVRQLEGALASCKCGRIFHLYIVKLGFQLAWVICGLIFVAAFFYGTFGSSFNCPNDFDGATDDWPVHTDVVCVFDILNLLKVLWIVEMLLLALAGFGLIWGLVWCFSVHPKELGSSDIAIFSYNYGLPSEYYVPKLPTSSCIGSGFRYLFHFSCLMQQVSCGGPRIKTNMDFLVMKLHCTDGGLGYIFKQVQVANVLKQLNDDDRRRLNIHERKHRNIAAQECNDIESRHEGESRDKEMDVRDLMWTFSKASKKVGIYRDFQSLLFDFPVILPGTMRGTVLGFAARAPDNGSAIEVSFGIPSFATSLARVFKWVTALNFNSDFRIASKVYNAQQCYTHTLSLTCPDDIFFSESHARTEFLESLKTIWVRPGSISFLQTGFIVIGPIPKERVSYLTTVDLLLETVAGCLCKDAVLLIVRPLQISNKDVQNMFSSYKPLHPSFEPLEQSYDVINQVQEWTARKSSCQHQMSQVLQSPERRQSLFRLRIVSGGTPCIIEFTTYRYTDTPHRSLPEMYRPTPPPLMVPTLPRAISDLSILSREPEPPQGPIEEAGAMDVQVAEAVSVKQKNAFLVNGSEEKIVEQSEFKETNI